MVLLLPIFINSRIMKNWLLIGVLFLLASTVFSQGKIRGIVTDGQNFIVGANIAIKGSRISASTDFQGRFSFNTATKTGELIVSSIGFQSRMVHFSFSNKEVADLGIIVLVADSSQLDEIMVRSGIIDIAKNRKTPVAVSTIRSREIQEKLGTQEFPEILKNTPSVYTSKGNGGFGDSRITIRGFAQDNIAVMINGVPVNDMEYGLVFWSNFTGLSDITTAIQVQRGLGSSKIVSASVGGSINIITKTADNKEGGAVSSTFGNNDYFKYKATYSTGKMANGLSASVLFSQTRGDGYVDGTQFRAKNYFIGLGYELNPKNSFQFIFTGAPQWHDQKTTNISIADYLKYGANGEPNRKLNIDAGYLKGEAFNMRTNYYHKPVASFNWDYEISEETKLSSVLYGSWARGGGTSDSGGIRGLQYTDDNFANSDGTRDYDKIYAWNSGSAILINGVRQTRTLPNGLYINSDESGRTGLGTTANPYAYNNATGITKAAYTNLHNWYGGVASLNTKVAEGITLDVGVDLRTYKGSHSRVLNDLLGGGAYRDNLTGSDGDVNAPQPNIITNTYSVRPNINPFWSSDYQEKITYNTDSKINWLGAFAQLEYSKNNLTAFVQGAFSQEAFKRIDYFRFTDASGDQETGFKKLVGGNIKAGLNYNINENHNLFVNSGYYSKQPFMYAVYPFGRNYVNDNLTNEKIVGMELGYGFHSSKFIANLNLYRTTWKDRFQTVGDRTVVAGTLENPNGYFSYEGLSETHQGAELDFNFKPINKLMVNGMLSYGNWFYNGNATSTRYTVSNQLFGAGANVLYLDKVKVGNAAQSTAAIGATYELAKRVKIDANYLYATNLYADFNPTYLTSVSDKGSLKLPSYGLVDAGFSYKVLLGQNRDDSVLFRLNVNNVLDAVYISESKTDIIKNQTDFDTAVSYQTYKDTQLYNGIDTSNNVNFGFGRTWNCSLLYNF